MDMSLLYNIPCIGIQNSGGARIQ